MKKKTKKQIESIIGKKIIFNLDIPPYNQHCIICCNGNIDDIIKYIKSLKRLSHGGKETLAELENNKDKYNDKVTVGCGRLYTDLPTGYIMIFNHNPNDWLDTTSTLSHECTHLSHYVLRRAGIELEQETEEAYTYLQAHILEEILRKIY